MTNQGLTLLSFIVIFLFTSCNPCRNTACPIGTYCNDGDCISLCEGINCVNGNCENGDCICDTGYQGTLCNEQITPSSVTITQIQLNYFPSGNYDNQGHPDLFFTITAGNSCESDNTIIRTGTEWEVTNSSLPRYWTDTSGLVTIGNIRSVYNICLWDEDGDGAHDLVAQGEISSLYTDNNDFPDRMVYRYPSDPNFPSLIIYLTWNFE